MSCYSLKHTFSICNFKFDSIAQWESARLRIQWVQTLFLGQKKLSRDGKFGVPMWLYSYVIRNFFGAFKAIFKTRTQYIFGLTCL